MRILLILWLLYALSAESVHSLEGCTLHLDRFVRCPFYANLTGAVAFPSKSIIQTKTEGNKVFYIYDLGEGFEFETTTMVGSSFVPLDFNCNISLTRYRDSDRVLCKILNEAPTLYDMSYGDSMSILSSEGFNISKVLKRLHLLSSTTTKVVTDAPDVTHTFPPSEDIKFLYWEGTPYLFDSSVTISTEVPSGGQHSTDYLYMTAAINKPARTIYIEHVPMRPPCDNNQVCFPEGNLTLVVTLADRIIKFNIDLPTITIGGYPTTRGIIQFLNNLNIVDISVQRLRSTYYYGAVSYSIFTEPLYDTVTKKPVRPTVTGSAPNCLTSETGSDYIGTQTVTRSGKTCEAWTKQADYLVFPDGNRNQVKNYCRNPQNSWTKPWCYVADKAQLRWEECSIPFCDTAAWQPNWPKPSNGLAKPYSGERVFLVTGSRICTDKCNLIDKGYLSFIGQHKCISHYARNSPLEVDCSLTNYVAFTQLPGGEQSVNVFCIDTHIELSNYTCVKEIGVVVGNFFLGKVIIQARAGTYLFNYNYDTPGARAFKLPLSDSVKSITIVDCQKSYPIIATSYHLAVGYKPCLQSKRQAIAVKPVILEPLEAVSIPFNNSLPLVKTLTVERMVRTSQLCIHFLSNFTGDCIISKSLTFLKVIPFKVNYGSTVLCLNEARTYYQVSLVVTCDSQTFFLANHVVPGTVSPCLWTTSAFDKFRPSRSTFIVSYLEQLGSIKCDVAFYLDILIIGFLYLFVVIILSCSTCCFRWLCITDYMSKKLKKDYEQKARYFTLLSPCIAVLVVLFLLVAFC